VAVTELPTRVGTGCSQKRKILQRFLYLYVARVVTAAVGRRGGGVGHEGDYSNKAHAFFLTLDARREDQTGCAAGCHQPSMRFLPKSPARKLLWNLDTLSAHNTARRKSTMGYSNFELMNSASVASVWVAAPFHRASGTAVPQPRASARLYTTWHVLYPWEPRRAHPRVTLPRNLIELKMNEHLNESWCCCCAATASASSSNVEDAESPLRDRVPPPPIRSSHVHGEQAGWNCG
jgi:hypothetical protein